MRTHIDEHKVDELSQVAKLADEYALTHKHKFVSRSPSFKRRYSQFSKKWQNDQKSQASVDNDTQGNCDSKLTIEDTKADGAKKLHQSLPRVCSHCKKTGHVRANCFFLHGFPSQDKKKNKLKSDSPKGTGLVYPLTQGNTDHCEKEVVANYKPFISEGTVSIGGVGSSTYNIKILRDTGATQSLLLQSAIPEIEKSATGNKVLISGVEMGTIEVPLHKIQLHSDLVQGNVVVGIRPSLPFEGISLLLGNDLAGTKVTVEPHMVSEPVEENHTEQIEKQYPEVFPACVVTRSMSKMKETIKDNDLSHDLSQTFMNHGCLADKTPIITRQTLVHEQTQDSELADLHRRVLSEDEADKVSTCFVKQNDLLIRNFRPPDIPANHEWAEIYQIVVPQIYRKDIMSIAHEKPMGGHLGVTKTFNRIRQHFYWPKMKQDVSLFCKTCHTCQMVGKPNQVIPPAPLLPIPVIEEPFSRIIVDCVGPLPKTKSGNEYLLTIMCAATRFPEAVPLRNIKTKNISKALIKFFTIFGLPKSIQSDQGSNFMSRIFQQIMQQLDIQHFKSSAYHPESQGALERFHQTLKTMLKTYCFEHHRDWDEGVHLLLFAVRESVQESLGFSPYELIFGHQVRGPLTLLKEKLLDEEDKPNNLLDYVLNFREKLSEAGEMAQKNLKLAQSRMKTWYDKDAIERSFDPGDKVLVLFPISGQTFHARYSGPFEVEQKVNDRNYVIKTSGCKKGTQLCHVNMLKPYYDRETTEEHKVQAVVATNNQLQLPENSISEGIKNEDLVVSEVKLQNSDVLKILNEKLKHLLPDQQKELEQLIHSHKGIFQDTPQRTHIAEHDVDVGDSAPIKQHPYRMSPIKTKIMQKEINYMLDHNIIEPSNSNWSSPCLLVPKKDGSHRFCTDYRKVNSVTKTDTFPIPRIEDCIDRIGKAKFVSKFDMLKGYYQIPLTQRAKEISAFVTSDGLYSYTVTPFGMKNSAATFQRMINHLIRDLEGCEGYIDDIIVYSDDWPTHIQRLQALFDRMLEANLAINLMKSDFGQATVTYLGYIVGQGQVKPVTAKIDAINKFPVPTNRKQLMRFLGMAGFYRKFCLNFSNVVACLTRLTSQKVKFV